MKEKKILKKLQQCLLKGNLRFSQIMKMGKKSSFTLVETILAISIGIMIVLSASGLYAAGSSAYKAGNVEKELVQNGRVALDRISRDIRQTGDIASALPKSEADIPSSEIMFRDGHDPENIRYIRYYLDGSDMRREIRFYYFDSDQKKTHVTWNSAGMSGESPVWEEEENSIIAENFSKLEFFGSPLVNIRLYLFKAGLPFNLASAVLGRNIN